MQHARIITNPKSILILAGALSACMTGSAVAQTFFAGDMDNFVEQDSPDDDLVIRDTFAQYLARSGGVNDTWHTGEPMPFDSDGVDWHFGYTFENLPTLNADATLEIRVRANPNITRNDSIHLQFTGTADTFGSLWGSGFADLNGGTWDGGEIATFTLNLGDLLGGVSIIDEINAAGYLDVFVQDDTTVDWMRLTVPAPGTASLLALGGMVAMRRRR